MKTRNRWNDNRLTVAAWGLLLALLLAGCNDALTEKGDEAVGGGRGIGVLNLSIDNRGEVATRAVGDPLPGLANPEEKKVETVAVFVRTLSDGEGKPGVFAGFFSDASDDDQKLSAPLKTEGEGLYSCQVTVRSPGWKQPGVAVIANYGKELGDRLKAVTRWEDLAAVLSTPLGEGDTPSTPLLMYGKIGELKAWENSEGGVTAASIGLERMVSRLDIENHAYKVKMDGDATVVDPTGYIIDSVRLVRTYTACYLLPAASGLDDLKVSAGFPAVKNEKGKTDRILTEERTAADGVARYTIQKVDTLYALENLNAKPATATAVMIFGRLNDNPLTKVVEFLDEKNAPIPLSRNHRYLITVVEGTKKNEVAFKLAVADWNEAAKNVDVSPTFMKPRLTNFMLGGVPDTDMDTKTEKVFSFTGADADGEKEISFDAFCPQNPMVGKLGFAYDADGSSVVSGTDWLTAADPTIENDADGKAWIKRHFTVKVSQNTEKVPVHIQIPVYNGVAGKELADTITIRLVPFYQGVAGALPVLFNGHYWAPVNEGATQVATGLWLDANPAQDKKNSNTAQCGKLYQWGRKQPFDFYVAKEGSLSKRAAPVTVEEASATTDFITSVTKDKLWMSPTDYTLWNEEAKEDFPIKNGAYDPCPDGWRMPSWKEWKSVFNESESTTITLTGDKYSFTNGVLTIKGDDGKLTLPLASLIGNEGTVTQELGELGYYWSSLASSFGGYSIVIDSRYGLKVNKENVVKTVFGYSVRCVQE